VTLQVTADAAGGTWGTSPPRCGGAAQGAKWPAPRATKTDPCGGSQAGQRIVAVRVGGHHPDDQPDRVRDGAARALGSRADICFLIAWRMLGGISCSSCAITPSFTRSRILPSRTTLPLPAQAGEKGLTVRLCDTTVSGSHRGYAMDLRVAFILEKLV
jgi:hypothetical protein